MSSLSSVSKALLATLASLAVMLVGAAWNLSLGDTRTAGIMLAAALLPTLAALWLNRANVSINKAIATLSEAAEGRLRTRVLGIRGQGNIGQMLRNINRTLDQMEAFTKETDAAMKAAAAGRYYRKIIARGLKGEFARYAESVNNTLSTMNSHASQLAMFEGRMLKDAVTITMTVNEGAIANARIVSGIRNAVREAQGMAAATEEMVAGIQEISHSSDEAASLSTHAQSETDGARQVVETAMSEFIAIERAVADAAEKVSALREASEAIGEILSSIESIASQTNLLALNATIEAARAGEAGKGFAVVANEVKNLANQTARATEDIGTRIANLRQEMSGIIATMTRGTGAIAKGREAMESMGGRMGEVSHMVADTTSRMSDVSRILSQQAAAANQISGGVQNVAAQAEDNAKSIEASSKALIGIETEMSSLLQLLAERDIPNKVILLAKSDHIIWKKRLIDMMIGRVALSADELSSEKTCRLGKWYYGPGSMPFRAHPAFAALEGPHQTVHQNGIEAVRAYNAGNSDAAIAFIAKVEDASIQVLDGLERLATEKMPVKAAAAGRF